MQTTYQKGLPVSTAETKLLQLFKDSSYVGHTQQRTFNRLGENFQSLCLLVLLKPNTHRRRRLDETVESRRFGGVYTNSQLIGDSFVVSSVWTHPSAVVTHTATLCVRIAESVGSRREFMYTPTTPTRRDWTVSSRRRRRCVLGFRLFFYFIRPCKSVAGRHWLQVTTLQQMLMRPATDLHGYFYCMQ